MRFISNKIDYAFKKIFGSRNSQEILISFNAIIYENQNIIRSLTIINPYNPGKIQSLKDSYLNVMAVLSDGSTVIIEMQVSRTQVFDKRVAYNLCKTYANQLGTEEAYRLLNQVIGVTITDFQMFNETQEHTNKFVFKEKTKFFVYNGAELELVFLELPKFQRQLPLNYRSFFLMILLHRLQLKATIQLY